MKRTQGGREARKKQEQGLFRNNAGGASAYMIGYKAAEAGGWIEVGEPGVHVAGLPSMREPEGQGGSPAGRPREAVRMLVRPGRWTGTRMARSTSRSSPLEREPGRAEPGGIRLRCSGKQAEQGKSQNSASSLLQGANPNSGAHCGGARVSRLAFLIGSRAADQAYESRCTGIRRITITGRPPGRIPRFEGLVPDPEDVDPDREVAPVAQHVRGFAGRHVDHRAPAEFPPIRIPPRPAP